MLLRFVCKTFNLKTSELRPEFESLFERTKNIKTSGLPNVVKTLGIPSLALMYDNLLKLFMLMVDKKKLLVSDLNPSIFRGLGSKARATMLHKFIVPEPKKG